MKPAQLRAFALSMPETTEEPHFNYSSFRVRGKIFVTVPPDEDRIHVFVGEEERQQALALHPEIVEVLTWGKKVVGVRIVLSKASEAFVQQLLRDAWRAKAPKSILRFLTGDR